MLVLLWRNQSGEHKCFPQCHLQTFWPNWYKQQRSWSPQPMLGGTSLETQKINHSTLNRQRICVGRDTNLMYVVFSVPFWWCRNDVLGSFSVPIWWSRNEAEICQYCNNFIRYRNEVEFSNHAPCSFQSCARGVLSAGAANRDIFF